MYSIVIDSLMERGLDVASVCGAPHVNLSKVKKQSVCAVESALSRMDVQELRMSHYSEEIPNRDAHQTEK